MESRDYWPDASDEINSLEAKALLHSLIAFRVHIRDSRVDVHNDSRTLKASLEKSGCKSSSVNDSVKEILHCSRQLNFAIVVHYVHSNGNLADGSSRACSDRDCVLSEEAWDLLERSFGPHRFGPTVLAGGVNALAKPITLEHSVYVYPSFS